MPDERIAYGARCTWWDSVTRAGKWTPKGKDYSIPTCPFCKGALFEVPNLAVWQAQADEHDKNGHEGYRAFIDWCQGKCFPGIHSAKNAYKAETGKDFEL